MARQIAAVEEKRDEKYRVGPWAAVVDGAGKENDCGETGGVSGVDEIEVVHVGREGQRCEYQFEASGVLGRQG